MKRSYRAIYLILAGFIFFSCHKRDMGSMGASGSLTLSKTSVRVDTATGYEDSVTVQSTAPWSAKLSGGGWLKMDASSGPAGQTVVRLTVLSNNGTAISQTATISFSAAAGSGIAPVTLTVTQKPPAFSLAYRKALGGTQEDVVTNVVARTADGGTVLAGMVSSQDGDVHGSHGGREVWVVKLTATADTVWTRTYGGIADDIASSIIVTADGGYAVAGYTNSNDGDVHGNHGGYDLWVLKLNANGGLIWSKTYGGTGDETKGYIAATADGGYVVAGSTTSNDGDAHATHGNEDIWLLKINAQGTLLWSQAYGGSAPDEPNGLAATPEGGFIITGITNSNDQDVVGFHPPDFFGFDMLVVKVDGNGNKIWAHAYGGTRNDAGLSVIATPGGYVITGYSNSNDGDVTGLHTVNPRSLANDMWVLKLDNNGNKLWSRVYGGTGEEAGLAIIATADGGYAVSGGAASKDGDVTGYHDGPSTLDIWVVKLDAAGNKQWAKTIGSSGDDLCFSILPVADGFLLTSETNGSDGDMAGAATHGDFDIWATKLTVQ